MNIRRILLIIGFVLLPLLTWGSGNPEDARPEKWAKAIEEEGLPNLHKVSDQLYRSAQPRKEGYKKLKEMGIKTIINLRRRDKDSKHVKDLGIKVINIPSSARFPKKRKLLRFLEIVSDPANQPVLVHCKHGADRAGAAVALYRIKIQKWDVEDAIDEMVKGGFNFHKRFRKLLRFIRNF